MKKSLVARFSTSDGFARVASACDDARRRRLRCGSRKRGGGARRGSGLAVSSSWNPPGERSPRSPRSMVLVRTGVVVCFLSTSIMSARGFSSSTSSSPPRDDGDDDAVRDARRATTTATTTRWMSATATASSTRAMRATTRRTVDARAMATSRGRFTGARATRTRATSDADGDADVVVVGSGIGGLTAAAMLAYYGKKVRGERRRNGRDGIE